MAATWQHLTVRRRRLAAKGSPVNHQTLSNCCHSPPNCRQWNIKRHHSAPSEWDARRPPTAAPRHQHVRQAGARGHICFLRGLTPTTSPQISSLHREQPKDWLLTRSPHSGKGRCISTSVQRLGLAAVAGGSEVCCRPRGPCSVFVHELTQQIFPIYKPPLHKHHCNFHCLGKSFCIFVYSASSSTCRWLKKL